MSENKAKEEALVPEDVSETELNQLMKNLAEENNASAAEDSGAEVRQLHAAPVEKAPFLADAEQSLRLELKGSINLKLCFASGERRIEVFCGEEALICRMADGTEFKIPTGIRKKTKAA